MNAMFLKELANRRGELRRRVELGKAGGGVSFGYRTVRRFENGVVSTGEREIVPEEADIVRRIFKEYIAGASPKQIAKALNAEGVRGPGRVVGTEHDPRQAETWNRRATTNSTSAAWSGIVCANVKNPDTGKRVSKPNPSSEWVIKDVPELRIVDDELWAGVQARYAMVSISGRRLPMRGV